MLPRWRWTSRVVICAAMVAFGGCATRQLSWRSTEGATEALGAAERVAVAVHISMTQDYHMMGADFSQELASVIAGELMARGYTVTLLREQAPQFSLPRSKEVLTAEAKAEPVAKIERETSGEQDMTARYEAARKAGAELLFEFSTQSSQKMVTHMFASPILFVPDTTSTECKQELRQITLSISNPDDQITLGVVTVRFSKPTDKIPDAVKDVLLGLDMLREGQAPGTLELTGPPGQASPDQATSRPASQPSQSL